MKYLNVTLFTILFSLSFAAWGSGEGDCHLFLNQKKDCHDGEELEVNVVHGRTCRYSCAEIEKVACAEMIYSANQEATGRSLSSKVFDRAYRLRKESGKDKINKRNQWGSQQR